MLAEHGANKEDKEALIQLITDLKFIPGGRYLYYAGRSTKFYNNCYLLRSEDDSREDWAMTSWKSESCLTTGGGIGNDYSRYRREGAPISRTGGTASGPVSKMRMVNEIGREVMQGGARRSAIYGSLNWRHEDILKFLKAKDWHSIKVPGTDVTLAQVKEAKFNWPAPLDHTNISANYDTTWLLNYEMGNGVGEVFTENVRQALKTGEPGFSFNFFDKEEETLRNACTEVTSADDSDVCNLGSINIARVSSLSEFRNIIRLAIIFLLHGTLRADLPYEKIYKVRNKNRRLGLGLMGIHEWLIQRGYSYEVVPELKEWLTSYQQISDEVSRGYADRLSISQPVANRAIAPTGTIGMLAGTTTGIEPIYAVAYKRRYLVEGKLWKFQYAVDNAARELIETYGTNPASVESAIDLASNPERRIKFQADVQDYVDMSISSTINIPQWGTELNNEAMVNVYANLFARYARRLRGITIYPDGSRGGQPLTSVPYDEVKNILGVEFTESGENNDICSIAGGGFCGS